MNKIATFFRVVMIIITAIWGIFFGILFPVTMMSGADVVSEPLADSPVMILWLVTSVLGFILPCFLTMLGKRRPAIVLSSLGILSILLMHFMLENMKVTPASFDAIITYMPLTLGGVSSIVANLLVIDS